MIKNVIVQSRKAIESCFKTSDFNLLFGLESKTSPFALISICGHTLDSMGTDDPVENWLFNAINDGRKLRELNCHFMHQICFGDVTEQHNWKPDIFTGEQADEIIDLVMKINENSEVEDLVIHCDAGISRSGAVAVFACRFLGLDENIVRNSRAISPNPHVLGLLMERSGLNQKYTREFFEGMIAKYRPKMDDQKPLDP